MNMSFSEHERIVKAKIDLNFSRPFFSYILLNFNVKQSKSTDKIPTMAVNQYGDLLWNGEFTKTLSDAELQGVLSHEAMHIATLTFQRKGNRDHMLWNMATDLIINTILLKDNVSLPKDCLLPDKSGNFEFTGAGGKKFKIENVIEKTAEDIYDSFSSHAEKIKMEYAAGEGDYKGSFDQHSEANGEGEENENGEKENRDSEAAKNANKEKWKKVATEAMTNAKMRGKGNEYLERQLGELLNPEIDWRTRLHQFITKDLPVDYTMRLPGRRYYSTGVYYPSVVRENLEVVVAIDVSGSISNEEYNKFLTEVVGIGKSFDQINMRILWWSTEVTNSVNVSKTEVDDLVHYKFDSTGGTTMSCVADYIEKEGINSRIYIFLTDGHIESTPKVPAGQLLFVLAGGSSDSIVKNYGEVAKLRMNNK